MATIVETIATIILLVLLMLWISHLLNGTATTWVRSKFSVKPSNSGVSTTPTSTTSPVSTPATQTA